MTHLAPRSDADAATDPTLDAVRNAFRELHGRRLHGFALLLTLGDRARAGSLASTALTAAIPRVDELRHPERAAAWLRHHVVERAGDVRPAPDAARSQVLLELGADAPVVTALAALGRIERAALIADSIERLDRRDVGTIVGREGAGLDRLVRRARGRYSDAYAVTPDDDGPRGPIVTRINELATQAMA